MKQDRFIETTDPKIAKYVRIQDRTYNISSYNSETGAISIRTGFDKYLDLNTEIIAFVGGSLLKEYEITPFNCDSAVTGSHSIDVNQNLYDLGLQIGDEIEIRVNRLIRKK